MLQTPLTAESSVSRDRYFWSLYLDSVCALAVRERTLCAFALVSFFLPTLALMHLSRASSDQHQQRAFHLRHFSQDRSAQIFFFLMLCLIILMFCLLLCLLMRLPNSCCSFHIPVWSNHGNTQDGSWDTSTTRSHLLACIGAHQISTPWPAQWETWELTKALTPAEWGSGRFTCLHIL